MYPSILGIKGYPHLYDLTKEFAPFIPTYQNPIAD